MQKIHELRQKTTYIAMFLNIILFFITFLINQPVAWGFIFGMCFSLICFNMRMRSINIMSHNMAVKHTFVGNQFFCFIFRNMLYAIAILLTLQYSEISVWSTIFGLISVNLVIVGLSVTAGRSGKKQTESKG
ncbi:ATP synthase subunit I [Candidatus Margulisiibacteriota bacterium]